MKKELAVKGLFVLFFIIMLWINLILPNIMNYDNLILYKQYDIYGLEAVPASYAQVLDNEAKVENFDDFLVNIKLMIFAVSFMFCIFFIIFDFKKLSATKLFLFISIPIGLIYVYLMPIGSVPDEPAHWYRAYEVSNGHIFSDRNNNNYGGRTLPTILKSVVTDDYLAPSKPKTLTGVVNSYDEWLENYEKAESKYNGEEEFIIFSNTALYSFITYLPQALGILIARMFSASYMTQAYCARIVNYLAYILVMSYAIKKLPFKKMALLLIAFLPLNFQETASLSIDGMQMAFTTLLISYTLYLRYDDSKTKLEAKDYIILLISSIITAITKFVYLPVCLLMYIIPKEKFGDNKKKYIILTVIFLIAALMDGLTILKSLSYENELSPETRMLDQVMYITMHPIKFVETILLTIQKYSLQHALGLFGQRLCWEDLDIASVYTVTLCIVTIYLMYFKKEECSDKTKNLIEKIFVIIVTVGTTFGIILTEYLTICPVGYDLILGIQSRYYLPLLLLYSVAFSKNIIKKENMNGIQYLMMLMIFVNLNALTNIMFRYL